MEETQTAPTLHLSVMNKILDMICTKEIYKSPNNDESITKEEYVNLIAAFCEQINTSMPEAMLAIQMYNNIVTANYKDPEELYNFYNMSGSKKKIIKKTVSGHSSVYANLFIYKNNKEYANVEYHNDEVIVFYMINGHTVNTKVCKSMVMIIGMIEFCMNKV